MRKYINIAALLLMLTVNFLANYLPINGLTTGQVASQNETLFTPAGYVFGIWGLIYLLLVGFVIYQAIPFPAPNLQIPKTGYLFAISCVLNSLWILAWHYQKLGLSMAIMTALLLTLALIYTLLTTGKTRGTGDKLLVNLPFKIYLAWISVATIANAATVLVASGWDGWGLTAVTWTIVMLAVATLLALLVIAVKKDLIFPLVFVWAFSGIALANQELQALLYTAAGLAAALLLVTVFVAVRRPQSFY